MHPAPGLAVPGPAGERVRGRTEKARRKALREYTETPVRQGVLQRPWDRVQMGLVSGTVEFARGILGAQRGNRREQRALQGLARVVSWEHIILALERVKGEKWMQFRERRGDWGW